MKRTEAECCDVVMTHTGTVEEVKKKMPGDGMIHDLADFYKVFGDATRIRILCVLLQAEVCVCDLAEILGMTQSAISHQLQSAEADEAGKKQKRRKNRFLFPGGWTYSDDHQPGYGAY